MYTLYSQPLPVWYTAHQQTRSPAAARLLSAAAAAASAVHVPPEPEPPWPMQLRAAYAICTMHCLLLHSHPSTAAVGRINDAIFDPCQARVLPYLLLERSCSGKRLPPGRQSCVTPALCWTILMWPRPGWIGQPAGLLCRRPPCETGDNHHLLQNLLIGLLV